MRKLFGTIFACPVWHGFCERRKAAAPNHLNYSLATKNGGFLPRSPVLLFLHDYFKNFGFTI